MGFQGFVQLRETVGQLLCELIGVEAFSLSGAWFSSRLSKVFLRLPKTVLTVHCCSEGGVVLM